jgi:hypothetical protein
VFDLPMGYPSPRLWTRSHPNKTKRGWPVEPERCDIHRHRCKFRLPVGGKCSCCREHIRVGQQYLTGVQAFTRKRNRGPLVYILSFFDGSSGGYTPRIHVLRTWNPSLPVCNSVSLCGDALVVADSRDRALVVNVHSPEDRAVVLESTTISDHPQTVRKPY